MDWAAAIQWLKGIDATAVSLGAVVLALAALAALWLGRRLRKPAIVVLGAAEAPRGVCARLWALLGRLLDAIDYLATRREWRYRQPWVLVLGEQGAGKSSLIGSVSPTWRYRAPPHADQLQAKGMRWTYLRHGVLIDAEGKLAAADEGSDEAAQWSKALDELDALRPERPLDGVILCVSARTLREARQSQRMALAENVNRQIGVLQASIEFMLPVYVVVTQCDGIPGFSAFWRSQDASRQAELVGYSAIAQDQDQQPAAWADTAFALMGARLRELQVDVAAHSEQIADIDNFFLFPGHFQSLREPLAQWLETVFRTTAWQSGHLFRGLYFTGSLEADGTLSEGVRGDVDFVDALVSDKVLRERALAKPTRQGIWSRNRLIRGMQVGAIVAMLASFVALALAGQQFSRQVDAIVDGIASLAQATPHSVNGATGECLAREDVYPLLAEVSRVNTRSRYVAIPLSWLDQRLTSRSAEAIGRSTVRKVLMPTLSCMLEARAGEMLASAEHIAPASSPDLDTQRAGFRQLVIDVRDLEDNLARFRTLALGSDALNERQVIELLDGLGRYVFDAPLPHEVWRPGNVLDDALRDITDVSLPTLPSGLRRRLAARMEDRGNALRLALDREVGMGDDLLAALAHGRQPVLDNTRRFAAWLAWVQQSWLASSDARNPCLEIADANAQDIKLLIDDYGFPVALDAMLARFDAKQCHQPQMQTLATMTLAPYGPLFVSGNGGLVLAAPLQSELAGLPALVSLPFMQLTATRPFQCVGAAASWRANEIAEAASYVNAYQAFAKAQPALLLPDGGRPLYDRLARQSLARAMDDAMRRAQQLPSSSPLQQVRMDALSRADEELARVGDELMQGTASLQTALAAYSGYGFVASGDAVGQCIRDFASDRLGGVDALADSGRLYVPPASASKDAMFDLGGLPVTKDFLARQIARAQVLGSYAMPFVNVLKGTPGVDDAWRDNAQTAAFWGNTLDEINRYTQGKEPTGQVAILDAFFIGQLSAMSYADCAEKLAAYSAPEYGNDLFSERRRHLERQVKLRCDNQREAQASELYDALTTRFDRDLAGRYPFGEPSARDAGLATVRAFFRDYAAQHEAIAAALVELDADRWQAASRFVDDLDGVATFLSSNVAAPAQIEVIGLDPGFPAQTAQAVGGDQVVSWRLAADDAQSVFPNGLKALQWFPGQPLRFDLQWAERSDWRPLADPAQGDLSVQAATASFEANGPWALLRFIDAHRVRGAQSKDPDQILLGFDVPVQSVTADASGKPARNQARVFMTLRLSGTDPQTQASKPIALPPGFPRSAPAD